MNQHSKKYDRMDWLKNTPYAGSDAKNPEKAINDLLEGYRVTTKQWTDHPGPNGRGAVTIRFNLVGRTYRVMVETLDVPHAEPRELRLQVLRVIYWTLKPLLENSLVFGGPDRLLLPFLEDDTGHTVYEQLAPHIGGDRFSARPLIEYATQQRALPAPRLPAPATG